MEYIFKSRVDKSEKRAVLFIPYLLLAVGLVLLLSNLIFNFKFPEMILFWISLMSIIQLLYFYSIIYFLNIKIDQRNLYVRIGLIVIDYIEIKDIEVITNKRNENWKYGLSNRYISIKGHKFRELNISPIYEKKIIEKLLDINNKIENKVNFKDEN